MPRIAFKDIKCYKKIIINSDGDFVTPFCYAKIKIGEQYRSRLRKYNLLILRKLHRISWKLSFWVLNNLYAK